MLLSADVLAGIVAGDVTLAFRRWTRPRVRPGTQLRTAVGVVGITDVEVISRAEVTDQEARRAGSPDAATLLRWLDGREGEWYRIHVVHVGEDPRIALRQQDDLSAEQVAELCATLERFDGTSTQGPWTRAVLDIIAAQPATLAADLAAELGLERAWFKRHVRKLRELGLTESLPTGYRLSPRGRVLREHLGRRDQRQPALRVPGS